MSLLNAKSPRVSPLHRLCLGLAVLGVALLPSLALAQQITVNTTDYDRVPEVDRDSEELTRTISNDDCQQDGYFSVAVNYPGTGGEIVARAGTCSADAYTEDDGCFRVANLTRDQANIDFRIPFRNIVQAYRDSTDRCGTNQENCQLDTLCDMNPEAGGRQTVTLMISVDESSKPISQTTWEVQFDLAAPDGPSDVSAGVGEGQLSMSWSSQSSTEINSYRFYCDPKPSASSQTFEPMGPSSGGTAGTSAGTGGTSTAGSGGASTGGTTGGGTAGTSTAGTGGATGGTGGASSSDCTSSVLVAGDPPPEEYRCGSTTSKTSGTVSGLTDFTSYRVAVAAVDDVGNVGTLSSVACGKPEPVDDFYEIYRRSGGKGGNGYCAINQSSAPGLLGVVLAAMGALVWRRRRNSSTARK